MFFSNVVCSSMENFHQRKQSSVDLNYGGKIILPHRCLSEIATKYQGELPNPMIFKLMNKALKLKAMTHCGVFDFSNSSTAFLPTWMMTQLHLTEGDQMRIEMAYVPIATYSKLKPMTQGFSSISEPVIVLEICLRQYSCLTVDDVIAIMYNNKVYEFKVEDLKPAAAVNIIECDMNLEFASTEIDKDAIKEKFIEEDGYKVTPEVISSQGFLTFGGTGLRLDGKIKQMKNENDLVHGITRGIPNYDYQPGSLNFYRRGVLMDDIEDPVEKDGGTVPFSGKGFHLK